MLSATQRKSLESVSEPWPSVKPDVAPSNSAWFGSAHQLVFTRLLRTKPKGIYMELGTWTGAGSTRHVSRLFGDMTLICIDTFAGSEEHLKHPEQRKIAANLWPIFCVNSWNEREHIFPVKKPSVEGMNAVAATGVHPDFIYIDAAHDLDSVFADITTALKLFPKAVVFGDDFVYPELGNGGVYLALKKAIELNVIQKNELRNFGRVWHLTRNV
jgi:hypothetical protein